jgi:PAS domain S-box-containing protein
MKKEPQTQSDKQEFTDLRKKASNILKKLGGSPFDQADMDKQRLLEELNVYHIELELQHEELQNTRDRLEASQKYLDDLYEFAPIGYIVLGIDGKIRDANRKAAEYFRVEKKILKGQRLQSFVPHDSLISYDNCLRTLLQTKSQQHTEVHLRVTGGVILWVRIDQFLIEDPEQEGSLILCSLLDISHEKQIEQELLTLNLELETRVESRTRELEDINVVLKKEIAERQHAEDEARKYADSQAVLLRELNHRVKNNMQLIVSLMKLQTRQTNDPTTLNALRESQNRIKALAMIHDILYMSEDLNTIPFSQYLKQLSRHIGAAYSIRKRGIRLKDHTTVKSLHLDQAVPVGLIIAELITNSIKYGFPDQDNGEIAISVDMVGRETVELVVQDDGIGLSPEVDPSSQEKLGLRLVRRIAEDQLGGSMSFDGSDGTRVVIRFKQKK